MLSVGSICTGYGGLEQGLKMVFPQAELVWVADNDKAASLLLATRYPGVPNLGDIKQIDWSTIPRVDILTAGIPCQPFSDAGLRQGHNDERDLTSAFLECVRVLRPKLVILENVPGFRKRGFSRVLGGLASMGFRIKWHSVRASHAGASHRRERVFVLAYMQDNGQQRPWETWLGWPGLENRGQTALDPNGSGLQGNRSGLSGGRGISAQTDWRDYEPAIRRWERITSRLAPQPTELGPKGNSRLSFRFSEWMMGLVFGWVTGFGFSRKDTARLIGNGVVPLHAALAIGGLVYE